MENLGNQGNLSSHFICEDKTDYAAFHKFSIKEKYAALKRQIDSHNPGELFMTRGLGDSKIQKYDIALRLSDRPGKLMIDFHDVPGEFTNPQKPEFQSEMLPLIGNCDVFIIAIDTPYLMDGNRCINNAHNRVTDMEVALQNIMIKDETDIKMVMLVPLKCEKWLNEGRINEVVDKIKLTYATLLKSLSSYPSMVVSILPIATIGGIKYSRLYPAYVIKRNGELTGHSCIKTGDSSVILGDGTKYRIEPPYSIDMDPEAKVDGVEIPNSWFEIDDSKGFSPYNSDQIALHILRFLIVKTILKEQRNKKESSGVIGFLSNALNLLTNWWNGIDYDAFKKLIIKLQDSKSIKDTGEGIEIVHVCPEWKEVKL